MRTVFEREAPDPRLVRASLAGSRRAVFWLEGIERPAHPALTGARESDLVIVGAGYAGLWTALRAKERDPSRRVMVLEAKRVGWAASGRNGGFCEASLTHGEENGRARWPEELTTLDALGLRNLDEIAETVERYGMDVELERTGALTVAVEPYQAEELASEPEVLDAAALRKLVDSPIYLAGTWERQSTALVHPGRLALELARVAVSLGVEIAEHSPVTSLDDAPAGDVLVRTTSGSVRTAQVVLATNAFPSLLMRNRLMTVPVYDYVLVTEPLSASQRASIGWEGRQGVADMGSFFHYYRQTADDRILFGGYDAVYHPGGRIRAGYEDRPETFERLASHFLTTFPQLEGLRFTHRWAGVIDTCSRFCAFYGVARGGRVAYAGGFTGLGVGATRFAADVMLDLLEGITTERTSLRMVRERPLPFPPEPVATIGVALMQRAMHAADHREGRRGVFLRTMDAVGMGFDS